MHTGTTTTGGKRGTEYGATGDVGVLALLLSFISMATAWEVVAQMFVEDDALRQDLWSRLQALTSGALRRARPGGERTANG
jgi:hypothetical protein